MATASRIRQPAGAKRRSRPPSLAGLRARDALATWLVPALAAAAALGAAALGVTGLVATEVALAVALGAVLVLLLFLGMRPLFAGAHTPRVRALGTGLAVVWLAACYAPFHARLFPGRPLAGPIEVTAAGSGLPLAVPAAGRGAIELMLAGHLPPSPGGGAAPTVSYQLTLDDGSGTLQTIDGRFVDTLRTQRLGRRGTAVVHQPHTESRHVLANPSGRDVSITRLVLEPPSVEAVTVSAYARRLPGPGVLALAAAGLLAAVFAFDRLGPGAETDGALTLATAAVAGTAIIFSTTDAVHPDFRTLIGAAIFGGAIGFACGALVWWVAKRLIARPA